MSTVARKANVTPAADFDFNLGITKGKVLKALDDRVTGQFRRFYATPMYDKLAQTVLLYFTTSFQLEWAIATMERARKQHIDGYNPYVVAARIHELEAETAALRMEISPLYSQIILQHSTYEKPQQDRKFFEAMYDSLISIVDDAFERLKKRPDIERDVGMLFRSKHFNLYKRNNMPLRSVDTLSVKELYALKHETSNRALNARTLASLFEKPAQLGVTVASVTNSPLISQYISSPIVARSKMKDPEQRDELLGHVKANARSPEQAAKRDIGAVFRSAAILKGLDPSKLQAQLQNMKLKAGDAGDLGLITADKARKGDHVRQPHGALAPEAAGLPVDETYNYLLLMKRYILYGPTLGMTASAQGPTAAQQAMAAAVPATPTGGTLNVPLLATAAGAFLGGR